MSEYTKEDKLFETLDWHRQTADSEPIITKSELDF